MFPFLPLITGFDPVCALHLPPQKGAVTYFSQKSFTSPKTSEQTSACCPKRYLEATWEQNSFENVTRVFQLFLRPCKQLQQ